MPLYLAPLLLPASFLPCSTQPSASSNGIVLDMSSNAKRPSFLDRSPTSAGSSPSAPTAKRARTELTSVEARLPSELFVRILAYCSRSTLGQIALTGHHLLDLARSQLWYKLRLDNEVSPTSRARALLSYPLACLPDLLARADSWCFGSLVVSRRGRRLKITTISSRNTPR